jgi:propanol-preferring alcohol dehydrogenase
MQALQITQWQHDPELREVDQPDPGPGEVRVRVGGAGACHSDLHLLHDFPAGLMPWDPPFTLGHENAGWVEAVGPGVSGLEIGSAVAVYGPWGCGRCHRCLRGMENYCERQSELSAAACGLGADGGMAPYLLVPNSRWVVPIGDLDPVLAAPLTDAGLTPYHAIARSKELLVPGSSALVIGAGGLGHMAVQILAATTAAEIIVVDRSPAALELAQRVGAHHTVAAGADAAAEVMELTGGKGVDVTVDLVGADETLQLGAAATRSLGHLTIVGIAGGTLPIGFFSIAYEVSVATTYWGSLPELVEVLALARSGRITPDVVRFDLADAAQAYEQLAAGTLFGRAVVVPG